MPFESLYPLPLFSPASLLMLQNDVNVGHKPGTSSEEHSDLVTSQQPHPSFRTYHPHATAITRPNYRMFQKYITMFKMWMLASFFFSEYCWSIPLSREGRPVSASSFYSSLNAHKNGALQDVNCSLDCVHRLNCKIIKLRFWNVECASVYR